LVEGDGHVCFDEVGVGEGGWHGAIGLLQVCVVVNGVAMRLTRFGQCD
jgi:hypothetical protein